MGRCSVLCVTNVVYATTALRGAFRSGSVLDLGWDAGLLLLAAAAAVAPAAVSPTGEAGARTISGNAARIAALVIGLAGIGAVAIKNALSAEPDVGSAVLVALAVVIIGLRLIHSTRADRRYATLLESEVASQTRSLMDSLAATPAAERNLRLLRSRGPHPRIQRADAGHGGAVRTTGKPQHLRVPGLRRGGRGPGEVGGGIQR